MSIKESNYRDVRALEVDTGEIRAKFLPDNGTRLISLIDSTGREWMASESGEQYKPVGPGDSYVEADVCGMDDMFPTIDPEIAPVPGGVRAGVEYDDHGEVCRHGFDWKIEDGKAIMSFVSTRLAYRYDKVCYAGKDGEVVIDYHIENLSDDPFPFLWAGHCMLAWAEGGKVELPYEDGAAVEIAFDENGEYGTRGTQLPSNADMLTSRAFSPEGNTYKFYYLDPTPKGEISYRVGERKFVMEYDKEKIPYVGVWMNNGKFKGLPCATPEPCTVAFDMVSEGAKRNMHSVIAPRGSFDFTVKLSVRPV